MAEAAAAVRVADELQAAARTLSRAGVEPSEREARVIWAALAGMHPAQVWIAREAEAPAGLRQRFWSAVARRAAGEPLAYVVGTAAFRTLELAVDRRVFIPRPETEGLVDCVLRWGRERFGAASWGSAADIGTGSGCVALSLAVEGRFERLVACDVSADALAVARSNFERVAPPVPVEFRAGALLAPLGGERFDVIVSNPPYIATAERDAVEPGVRAYEPGAALWSGPDGLEHTRALLAAAPAHLVGGGLFALELDWRRAAAVLELARASGWSDPRIERDLFGRSRYLLARWE